jgi:hypothetical protein
MMKNIERKARRNDKPYAINRHHQGKINEDFFFGFDCTDILLK